LLRPEGLPSDWQIRVSLGVAMPEKAAQSKMNGSSVIKAAAAKKPVISSQLPVWAARTLTAAPFLRFMARLLLGQDVLASGMSRIGGEGKGLLHLPQ
jgi:hypothetical protein